MYLDLTDVLRAPGNASEKTINMPPQMLDDIELTEPVNGAVRAANARQNIVVSGNAHTSAKMVCSRCLNEYSQPLDLDLETVAPMSFFRALQTGLPVEEEDLEGSDDEIAALFDGNSVDVTELIRQAIVLQSPIQPLCSPDCPGLPEAEQYLGSVGDERFAALKNWQKKENNGTP